MLSKNYKKKENEEWNFYQPKIIDPTKHEYLYINIDDTYLATLETINSKKQKLKNQFRVICIHQGENQKKELINKTLLTYRIKDNAHKFNETFKKQLVSLFGDLNNYKIIVCGDGAKWIKILAKHLKAKFLLDKFHLFRKIKKAFNYYSLNKNIDDKLARQRNLLNSNFYKQIIELISKLKYNEILKLLNNALDNEILKSKKIQITQLINYIKTNWSGIRMLYNNKIYNKCLTETFIKSIIKIKTKINKIYGWTMTKLIISAKTLLFQI